MTILGFATRRGRGEKSEVATRAGVTPSLFPIFPFVTPRDYFLFLQEFEMAETEVRVGLEYLRSLLFGGMTVIIHGIRYDEGARAVFFDVHGSDVPENCQKAVVMTRRSEDRWLEPDANAEKVVPC